MSNNKKYPYFIKILDKVINNYINDVENEDLPCLEKEETKPKEDSKEVQKTIEEKKE